MNKIGKMLMAQIMKTKTRNLLVNQLFMQMGLINI